MSLFHYADLFRAESLEHIAAVNHLLLSLEAQPTVREPLEGVFRAVHTIKGMAATMGYAAPTEVAHEMEGVLDGLRHGRLMMDPELIELLFRATDVLQDSVETSVAGDAPPDTAEIVARLRALTVAAMAHAGTPEPAPGAGAATSHGTPGPNTAPNGATLRVRLVVAADSALPGVRAFMALQRARELGAVGELVPPDGVIQQDSFNGILEFSLRTDSSPDAVYALLYGVGEVAELSVEPARTAGANGTAPTATRTAVHGMANGAAPNGATASNGVAASGGAVSSGAVNGPSRAGATPADSAARGAGVLRVVAERHVRVEAVRLDALMDRTGELVILRDRLVRVAAAAARNDLTEPVEQMARLIGELRDELMRIRMVPVGDVFDRFPRLVRDVARDLDKTIDFVVEGRDTELDRSLLERIGDPLVHLLRNAVDHGIETPAERRARGKPEAARLRLSAHRERTRVVIRVEDDGRGIDQRRVAAKAVELGLVSARAAEALTAEEMLALILRPGFSTAERVTDVSGRGVGLDVVATRVRSLGGLLDIDSRPGEGSCFTLRLPLTVGILRAVLVRSGAETYALPVAHVAETVEFLPSDIHQVGGKRVALLRGEPVQLVRLRDALRQPHAPPASERVAVVLLELDDEWTGLEVDALLGQQEIIIKPFDGTRETLPIFSGATILSDGRPALIVDIASLLLHGHAPGQGHV